MLAVGQDLYLLQLVPYSREHAVCGDDARDEVSSLVQHSHLGYRSCNEAEVAGTLRMEELWALGCHALHLALGWGSIWLFALLPKIAILFFIANMEIVIILMFDQ
jgi:hypothetical protein